MSAYLSRIGRRRGGRLFEAGRLLTFSAFRMGAYSRFGAYSNKYGIPRDNSKPVAVLAIRNTIETLPVS